MQSNIKELMVLAESLNSEEFLRRTSPYIQTEYFEERTTREIYTFIKSYFNDYNEPPQSSQIRVHCDELTGFTDDEYKSMMKTVDDISKAPSSKLEWCMKETEKWARDRAVFNVLSEGITLWSDIKDGKKVKTTLGSIAEQMNKASSLSFDTKVGSDYVEDVEERIDYLTTKEKRVPTHLSMMDKILAGGFPVKTLNCFLAPTNVGKSLVMCAIASEMLKRGTKVLYVTLEMSVFEIQKRIDANLSNKGMARLLEDEPHQIRESLHTAIGNCKGQLVVEEYPTASVDTGVVKTLLEDLRHKKNFVPDIVFLDYLNLFNSSRVSSSSGMYYVVKSITEELRGIAVQYELPIVTATQSNRDGFNSSDLDLTNTSESIGLSAGVDWQCGIIRNDQLDDLGQVQFKQLKNRYFNKSEMTRFVLNIDVDKMKLVDLDDPNMDDSLNETFGVSMKNKFSGFNFSYPG